MTTLIRFGIIGAGQISQYACETIRTHPAARIIAIQDVAVARATELAKANGARAYATVEELLADPTIDAVYIAVPNKFHAPLAIQALHAGKHVLLDKPFALNLDEAETVAAAARASGRQFMLGMNQRFSRDAQKVRALVAAGTLGEIYHGKAHWYRRAGIPKLGTWFGNKALAGGGALLDIGVHLLDLALWEMDNFEPVAVSGATYTRFGNRGLGEGGWGKSDREAGMAFDVDDFASALIKFSNGATLTLDVSWACHTGNNDRVDVQLFGTDAGAAVFPSRLFRPGAGGDYQVIEQPDAAVALAHCDRFHHFVNVLLGSEQPIITIDQALTVQQILDAIYTSCRTGREVRLERTTAIAA